MNFKIGYEVRPKNIINNTVIFEKEVIIASVVKLQDVLPTKDECLAYGFNWGGGDSSRVSVCTVKNKAIDLPTPNNMLSASRLDVLGADVNNTLVVGDNNQVDDYVNNSIVSGTLSKVSANNSIVLGGNKPLDNGEVFDNIPTIQNTTLMHGRQTITSGWVTSYLNNTSGSFFNVPNNTAMYFHAEVLAVRVGGTGAGNPGDFASWVERGVIINKAGVTSIQRERDAIKHSGTVTHWLTRASVSATNTNFVLEVKGSADVIIEWASTIRFTEIYTNVDLIPK